jgi:hypothetical protein
MGKKQEKSSVEKKEGDFLININEFLKRIEKEKLEEEKNKEYDDLYDNID